VRWLAAATDPAIQRIVRDLPSRYPADPGDPVARVVESGQAEILTGAGASVFGPAAARTGDLQADFGRAAMLVPLKARAPRRARGGWRNQVACEATQLQHPSRSNPSPAHTDHGHQRSPGLSIVVHTFARA
jgi:hypothetical protein